MEAMSFIGQVKNKILDIAVIILTLIFVTNIYKSQNRNIESLKAKRDGEIQKNDVLSSISQLEKKVDNYKNIFNKKDLSMVINTLTNMARDSNVKVAFIEPRPAENYAAYVKYPFSLVIKVNSYHAIGKFISRIENSTDVFSVDSANILIAPVSSGPEKTYRLTVNLIISTIVFRN